MQRHYLIHDDIIMVKTINILEKLCCDIYNNSDMRYGVGTYHNKIIENYSSL